MWARETAMLAAGARSEQRASSFTFPSARHRPARQRSREHHLRAVAFRRFFFQRRRDRAASQALETRWRAPRARRRVRRISPVALQGHRRGAGWAQAARCDE